MKKGRKILKNGKKKQVETKNGEKRGKNWLNKLKNK